ncbi:MAG: exosortase C-terminal domain/associated protein EpsI, partial [Bryobacteraceae bacterium]
MNFLKSAPVRILTVFLLAQAAIFYGMSRGEQIPVNKPVSEAPTQFGSWTLQNEGVVEKEVQDVLKADQLLTRTYANPGFSLGAHLFVAYFKSQRSGQAPHSPKNCLPGSGWIPSMSDVLHVSVPGRAEPIEVNRYLVQKGDSKSLVIYWYQSRDRVVASEYTAKAYVIADAL